MLHVSEDKLVFIIGGITDMATFPGKRTAHYHRIGGRTKPSSMAAISKKDTDEIEKKDIKAKKDK